MHQWYYPWSILVSITTPFISAYFMIQFVWQTEMCSYYTLTRMIESTQHWAMSGWQCSYRITSENIRHHVINKGGTMLRSVWSFHCELSWPSDTCGQCSKIFKSVQCIFCEQQEEEGGWCCCCWWDCSTNVWWVVDWCQQQQQLGPVSVQPMAGCLCHNHDHHRLHNVHSQLAYVRILTSHQNLSTASKKQQLFWFNVNVNGSQQLQGLLD